MKVTIKEARSCRELKKFVHFPNEMYKGNKYYVPTIESADFDLFNPRKNHAFEFCECCCWLAYEAPLQDARECSFHNPSLQ